jgi:ribosomal protein S2
MKIKKIWLKKYNLIQLYLLKYQTYKYKQTQNIKTNFIDLTVIDQIKLYIKHAFYVIHQYHFSGKTILFVGLPNIKQKNIFKILKLSKHYFIPENIWINGLLSNKISIFRHLKYTFKKQDLVMNLLSIKKNPHLIVIFNPSKELNTILEAYKLNIPVITLGTNMISNSMVTYKIPGIFLKNKIKIFFQFLIYTLLKKYKLNLKDLSRK